MRPALCLALPEQQAVLGLGSGLRVRPPLFLALPEQQAVLGVDDTEPLEAAGLDVLDAVPLVQHHIVVLEPLGAHDVETITYVC